MPPLTFPAPISNVLVTDFYYNIWDGSNPDVQFCCEGLGRNSSRVAVVQAHL